MRLTHKNWLSEGTCRMLQNNLDPDPPIVDGRRRAARNWTSLASTLQAIYGFSCSCCPLDNRENIFASKTLTSTQNKQDRPR